jgi:4,5-dihydroxyphthalate decarboxylase
MSRGIDRRAVVKGLGAVASVGAVRGIAQPRVGGLGAAVPEGELTLAGYATDRVAGLTDGRVSIEGYGHTFEKASIYDLNRNAMGGEQRWEAQEIGLHPYMLAFANDEFRDYTLLPVFPLRTFRHKSVFVRTDRGIEKPADLRGKRVATAGYSQSSLVWIRGMLQHEYGVEPKQIEWVVSQKSSDKGVPSKNEGVMPEGISIEMGPAGVDESELLVAGEVDAVFSALEPKAFIDRNPIVARLFPDARGAEQAYFAKTGIFPIMHVVAMRRDVARERPELPQAVFEAYSEAKSLMYADMAKYGWLMSSLPWFATEFDSTRELMGEDYWPYGIGPNRKALEALFQYSHEQGLAKRKLTVEELFHPSTLE